VRLRATSPDSRGRLRLSGGLVDAALAEGRPAGTGEREVELTATRLSPKELMVSASGETWRLQDPRAGPGPGGARGLAGSRVDAPMAGRVVEVRASTGDRVEEGQVLFVVESMKMQLEVASPAAGVVREVLVEREDVLKGPDTLAVLSAAEGE
jgi:biotin carboxyl carrier protein